MELTDVVFVIETEIIHSDKRQITGLVVNQKTAHDKIVYRNVQVTGQADAVEMR